MSLLSNSTRQLKRLRFPPNQFRKISISCRGKPIDQEDLFKYTNGRFLVHEKQQCESRYVKFDLEALCDIAASTGSSKSPIRQIEKMEGGFSKVLLLQKEDGSELIAKIPCPNAGPAKYVTSSEAAVMQYVRTHTTIPLPRVYAWSSNPSKPVGAEYILMEKASGVQLFKVWDELEDASRFKLMIELAKIERQLTSIKLPASGSLYFRKSMANEAYSAELLRESDPGSLYCVGLSCDRSWWPIPSRESIGHPGPWPSFVELGVAITEREIKRIIEQPRVTNSDPQRGTDEEQITLLKTAGQLMETLHSYSTLTRFSQPTMHHTDLHMGNIYVDPEDPASIVSIIDWQHTQIAPLFLQARWPVFLEPKEDYPVGAVQIHLPKNFNSMDEEDKALAKYEWREARATKAYEARMFIDNHEAYKAMVDLPRVLKELFVHSGEVWGEGCTALRECLIEICRSWKAIKLPGEPAIVFTETEILDHQKKFKEYGKWHSVRSFARQYLSTDFEGWVSPELDFEEKIVQNRELFELYAGEMAEGRSREEIKRMWPFSEALLNCATSP